MWEITNKDKPFWRSALSKLHLTHNVDYSDTPPSTVRPCRVFRSHDVVPRILSVFDSLFTRTRILLHIMRQSGNTNLVYSLPILDLVAVCITSGQPGDVVPVAFEQNRQVLPRTSEEWECSVQILYFQDDWIDTSKSINCTNLLRTLFNNLQVSRWQDFAFVRVISPARMDIHSKGNPAPNKYCARPHVNPILAEAIATVAVGLLAFFSMFTDQVRLTSQPNSLFHGPGRFPCDCVVLNPRRTCLHCFQEK